MDTRFSSCRAVMGLRAALAAALSAVACAVHAGAATPPAEPGEALVTPLVGLDNGSVRQCGVRVNASLGDADLAAEIALERRGRLADLAVRGSLRARGSGQSELADIRLQPRTAELPDMPPHSSEGGTVERRSAASDPRIAAVIQDLMIAGAVLVATRADGSSERIEIRGPLSQAVRASYLNCAGDLYRPGD